MTVLRGVAAWFALACVACACPAQGPRLIVRAEYEDRLRGMWLGESIANWTGLLSEGKVTQPPFLTDDDWGIDLGKGPLRFILDQDPWLADDDTDVEYVYLHLLDLHGATELTGEQVAAGWLAHMDDDYLWVSNQRALDLMRLGLVPPETGMCNANEFWLKIDAQLTTEFFGALAPGMPGEALEMADLPIRTTARSHAAHAAQFHVLLSSLAPLADPSLPMEDRILWMVVEARRYLPDSSKAADIVDFVLADFLANPDPDDWERTRDLVYDRYQLNAESNGFRYRAWTESSVNVAAGLIALLYGRGDFLRTVQIGTLTGWDSDNGTATMGGLLGLMLGHEALVAQIRVQRPEFDPSDRYDIERTRNNLPDRLPDDPHAQDTFTMMAARCADVAERRIREAGGIVHTSRTLWLIPPTPEDSPTLQSTLQRDWLRSANNRVRAEGGDGAGRLVRLVEPAARVRVEAGGTIRQRLRTGRLGHRRDQQPAPSVVLDAGRGPAAGRFGDAQRAVRSARRGLGGALRRGIAPRRRDRAGRVVRVGGLRGPDRGRLGRAAGRHGSCPRPRDPLPDRAVRPRRSGRGDRRANPRRGRGRERLCDLFGDRRAFRAHPASDGPARARSEAAVVPGDAVGDRSCVGQALPVARWRGVRATGILKRRSPGSVRRH